MGSRREVDGRSAKTTGFKALGSFKQSLIEQGNLAYVAPTLFSAELHDRVSGDWGVNLQITYDH